MKSRPKLLSSDDIRLIAICLHEGSELRKIAYYVYGISSEALKSRLKSCNTNAKMLLNNPIPEREYQ